MNVLIVSSLYPEPSDYGIKPDTKAIHYYAKEWVSQGHKVVVVHPYWNAFGNVARMFKPATHRTRSYVLDGVYVVFGEAQIFTPHKKTPSRLQQRILAQRMEYYLSKHLPSFKPDYVVVHFPIVADEFNSHFVRPTKSVCTIHGVDIRSLMELNSFERNNVVTKINSRYSHIYYRSKVLSKSGYDIGLRNENESLVISGVDEDMISSLDKIEEKWSFANANNISIIYAGKVVKQKRIHTIIEALSMLPQNTSCTLLIVGDGSEVQNLKILASRLLVENKVKFLGNKSRDVVSQLMFESKIFVMLSKGETLGLVYLEAMGQGCITIGSKGEGIDGIIENGGNGFLCSPENPKELSEIIMHILKMSVSEQKKIAINGYDTVSKLKSSNMAEVYLKMIMRK